MERRQVTAHPPCRALFKGGGEPKRGGYVFGQVRVTLCESGRCIDALQKRGRVLKKRGRGLKKVCLVRGKGGLLRGGWLLKGGRVFKNPVAVWRS